jgi:hypothetical protein
MSSMRPSDPMLRCFPPAPSAGRIPQMDYPTVTVRVRQHHVWWTDEAGRPRVQAHENVLSAIAQVESLRSGGVDDAVIDVEGGERSERVRAWEQRQAR